MVKRIGAGAARNNNQRVGSVNAGRNNSQRVGSVSAIMQPQEATIANRKDKQLGASSVITIMEDGMRKRAAEHRDTHNNPGDMASQRLIKAMAAAAGTTAVIGINMPERIMATAEMVITIKEETITTATMGTTSGTRPTILGTMDTTMVKVETPARVASGTDTQMARTTSVNLTT